MAHENERALPRPAVRVAGLLYLAVIVLGAFAEFYVRGSVIVPGNAIATGGKIEAAQLLYRLATVCYLADTTLYVFVSVVLYEVLRPVNNGLSLLGLAFSLVGSAVGSVTLVFHLAPLLLLSGDAYLSAFSAGQLQTLTLLSLKLHTLSYQVCLVAFALHLVVVGSLIAASGLLPRLIGILLVVGAICYLINSIATFVHPPLAALLSPYILLPAVAGESLLAMWMLAFGVSASKWMRLIG